MNPFRQRNRFCRQPKSPAKYNRLGAIRGIFVCGVGDFDIDM